MKMRGLGRVRTEVAEKVSWDLASMYLVWKIKFKMIAFEYY
jgi:hypothetical protein